MTSYDFARPHEAFVAGFFRDPGFDFGVRGLLGRAPSGAAEPGEVLATIAGIKDGDVEAWHAAWFTVGRRLASLGDDLRETEHFDSAAGAYLRAASYLSTAVNSATREDVQAVFSEYVRAWDGFIDTTVYLAERVEIPYTGTTLPGYLVKPSDDEAARATLILNNGSEGSHAAMWGDAAFGALTRGYNVLFFDGPGQQSMLVEHGTGFRHDWEHVLTPVVDFLLSRTDVEADRIAAYGAGLGGYWIPRALAFEHRIAAAIVDPGVTEVAASWMSQLSAPLARLFEQGKQDAFDRDLALDLRFNPRLARDWAFRARPFQKKGGYFETLTEVRRYALGDLASRITTPLFITSAEGEQFWPGQSRALAESLGGDHVVEEFTAAEGADFHGQPMNRTLTQQRMFDWLDVRLSR